MHGDGGPTWNYPPLAVTQLVSEHHRLIEDYGYSVVGVAAEGALPGWFYTVGLWGTCAHPELLCIGLPAMSGAKVLQHLADEVMSGRRLTPRSTDTGVFAQNRHAYVPVGRLWRERSDWFNLGRLVRFEVEGTDRWPHTLQVVWPDRLGRFPGDGDTEPGFQMVQPLLSEHDEAVLINR